VQKINFLLITPNYKESEVCMNEMGAAWMTDSIVLPLIVDPINIKTVGVIQEPNQIEKLLDEKSLDRIKDIVQEELQIPNSQIKSDRWTSKKKEFLVRVKKYIENNPFVTPIDRNIFDQLLQEKDDLEKTIEGLIEEKAEQEVLITELKQAKDKSAVAAIIKKHKNTSQFDEFEGLCTSVGQLLNKQDSIINGIIFKSYSGKKIDISWEGNSAELDEAFAHDYINEDLEIEWDTTHEMRKISKALDKVSTFLDSKLNSDFYDAFQEKYHCPLKMNNLGFWKEVFKANVTFN